MPLNLGTKLGPYEIQSPLGAGGMGEVYKARDTRLDRTVAVKILPSHLSETPGARQRFDREARTISSLNHPNICTLHDIGQQDGVDYLVMEYLEGETLAERLKRGPIPVDQVLKCAIEICDGLEKAHRSGIVHRDLKPGNIMLTKMGAKLMDFGLAKASLAGADANSGLTATLTTPVGSHPLTTQGTLVGTFQYMAPEQVEGKEADARSDIFALGAVLYEMATGKRAFEGKTAASAMAAVLEREPVPISSLQATTPRAFDRLVTTCLAKDPDDRWQTAHDVKLQLKEVAQGGSAADSQAVAAAITTPRKPASRLPWLLAVILAVVAVMAMAAAYVANQKQLPVLRVDISAPEKTHFNLSGDNSGPAMVSPDGREIVFAATGANGAQLYLRALDDATARPLPGTEGGTFPFWSPDSRSVAFFTADKLKRVDISGGSSVSICDGSIARGGTWNRDGTILAALYYNSGIFRVPDTGGTPTPITTVDNVTYSSHRWPFALPDGKHFLYLAVNHDAPTGPNTAIFFASLDGKENRKLFSSLSSAIYAGGYLLFMRDNSLMAQPFDPFAGKLTGEPQTLHENVQYDTSIWRANLSTSDGGMMLYASGGITNGDALSWYDRGGKQIGTVGEPGSFQEVELSPDNKKLAITDMNSTAATIWIYDLGGKPRLRLTYNSGVSRSPVWSPDGAEIAFTSHQQESISAQAASGGTPERILLSSPAAGNSPEQPGGAGFGAISSWSRDGRYLMYTQGVNLFVLPLFGEAGTRKPIKYTEGRQGVFSPDGHWVAYSYVQQGQVPEVFVSPFPWTGAKWQVSQGFGIEPRWRSDGKEIYYYDLSQIFAAEVNGSGSTFQVGNSQPLFRATLAGLSMEYAASSDGQRFIAITPSDANSQHLTLVQNWMAELTAH
jgi:eukaryotic-like serine/threonine-protein kinase